MLAYANFKNKGVNITQEEVQGQIMSCLGLTSPTACAAVAGAIPHIQHAYIKLRILWVLLCEKKLLLSFTSLLFLIVCLLVFCVCLLVFCTSAIFVKLFQQISRNLKEINETYFVK